MEDTHRQQDSSKSQSQKKPAQLKQGITIAIFITSLVLITLAGRQLLDRHKATTGNAPLPNSSKIVTEDVTEPDEAKVNADDYRVPSDQPRVISIPKINASGPLQKVGVTPGNAIAAPTNVNFAGWYTSSPKPGENGLSVIDGHVSGKYSDGIFKNLDKLNHGDQVIVEFGDKSQKHFEVVETITVPETEAVGVLLKKLSTIERQLNLITCSGAYQQETQRYADRTIVITRLMP